MKKLSLYIIFILSSFFFIWNPVFSDSVMPYPERKYIVSDPDGLLSAGDIITFRTEFIGLPNGAIRGMGAYLTDYIPSNTEVVGARIVDSTGTAICVNKGAFAPDGWGPRGQINYNSANFPTSPAQGYYQGNGSIASLYSDTGIFYSSDSRTAKNPHDGLLAVTNGISMITLPTGAGQLDNILGFTIPPSYSHNTWDFLQGGAFGCSGCLNPGGAGATPFGYGSPVAGPHTFFQYEATEVSSGVIGFNGSVGPWNRIKTPCAEVGTGAVAASGGLSKRNGVTTSVGHQLSSANPLPASVNAIRYSLGEIQAGKEYFIETSLRVKAVPIDPGMNNNYSCSEVFAGDASSLLLNGTSGGKDNSWRYFVPGPVCANAYLKLNVTADKTIALTGNTITYTITARNTHPSISQTSVIISSDGWVGGASSVTIDSVSDGGIISGGGVTWPSVTIAPNSEIQYTMTVTVQSTSGIINNEVNFVSDQTPAPGYSSHAVSVVGALSKPVINISVSPESAAAGSTVSYTISILNQGTGGIGPGTAGMISVDLPPQLTVISGTTRMNGFLVAEPVFSAPTYTFQSGLPNIAAGAGFTLTFDALIDGAALSGMYSTSPVFIFLNDAGFVRNFSDLSDHTATVTVNTVRSDAPVINPASQNDLKVCGTSSEATGSTVTVQIDLLDVGSSAVSAGTWCVNVSPLMEGQTLTATVQNTGNSEIISSRSAPVIVQSSTPLVNHPPAAPVLVSPLDGSTGIDFNNVIFKWMASKDPDNDKLEYTIEVCTDAGFTTGCIVPVVANSSHKLPISLAGVILIIAGFSARKRLANITIMLFSLMLIFTAFQCGKEKEMNLLPFLAFGFSSPGSSNAATVNASVTGLTSNTLYYWRVTARDGRGGEAASAVWSFRTN